VCDAAAFFISERLHLWRFTLLLADAVSAYLDESFRKGLRAESVDGYWSQLHLLMEWLFGHGVEHVQGVTALLLESYVGEMRQRENLQRGGGRKLSPVTVKKRVLFLRQFFGWCAKRGYARENVAMDVEVPKAGRRLPKVVAKADIARLFDTSLWRDNGLIVRDVGLLRLMFDSGLRLAELCALDLDDVNLDACIVHVRSGKWDQERFSVFTHGTADALREYLRVRRVADDCAAFFTNEEGGRLTPDGMYKIAKRRGTETGVKISPHRARHSFVTYSLESGAPLATVQQLAGHGDPRTTANYNWVALGKAQQAHEGFSPLRGILPTGSSGYNMGEA
jgi:site-specific recombinase XerD